MKTVDDPLVEIGDPMQFTLAVTNNGPSTATGLTVIDLLPGGMVVTGLGVYFLRRHTSLPTAGRIPDPPRRSLGGDFRNGAVLVAANPLVPINWLALVTAAASLGLDPNVSPPRFAAGVSLGVVSWFATMLWVLSSVRHRLSARQLDRIMHGLGAVLVVAGVLVIWREIALHY